MASLRIVVAPFAALASLVFVTGGATASECRHTAAEYAQVIQHFESEAAKARALAGNNPLYDSDVAYYNSVLADARACQRQLTPVATASR
jgi:hypothetical protein